MVFCASGPLLADSRELLTRIRSTLVQDPRLCKSPWAIDVSLGGGKGPDESRVYPGAEIVVLPTPYSIDRQAL